MRGVKMRAAFDDVVADFGKIMRKAADEILAAQVVLEPDTGLLTEAETARLEARLSGFLAELAPARPALRRLCSVGDLLDPPPGMPFDWEVWGSEFGFEVDRDGDFKTDRTLSGRTVVLDPTYLPPAGEAP